MRYPRVAAFVLMLATMGATHAQQVPTTDLAPPVQPILSPPNPMNIPPRGCPTDACLEAVDPSPVVPASSPSTSQTAQADKNPNVVCTALGQTSTVADAVGAEVPLISGLASGCKIGTAAATKGPVGAAVQTAVEATETATTAVVSVASGSPLVGTAVGKAAGANIEWTAEHPNEAVLCPPTRGCSVSELMDAQQADAQLRQSSENTSTDGSAAVPTTESPQNTQPQVGPQAASSVQDGDNPAQIDAAAAAAANFAMASVNSQSDATQTTTSAPPPSVIQSLQNLTTHRGTVNGAATSSTPWRPATSCSQMAPPGATNIHTDASGQTCYWSTASQGSSSGSSPNCGARAYWNGTSCVQYDCSHAGGWCGNTCCQAK